MPNRLRIRRGNEAQLPNLLEGEPGYSVDTHKLHIGNATGGNTTFINNEQIDLKLKDKEAQLTQKIDNIQNALYTHYTANQEQSNFDFIENEVVQKYQLKDYRINKYYDGINNSDILKIPDQIVKEFIFLTKFNCSKSVDIFWTIGNNNFIVYGDGRIGLITVDYGLVILKTGVYLINKNIELKVTLDNGIIKVFINGELKATKEGVNGVRISNLNIFGDYAFTVKQEGTLDYLLYYAKSLTPQEIQHTFSVLNNSPSIKELYTTDSNNKTNISRFASDEDHVEMATGRTLRDEYMGVLKTMSKEFVSADGNPIEVNNGIEARVISAEIKGQTVKNIFKETAVGILSTIGFDSVKTDNKVRFTRASIGATRSHWAFGDITYKWIPSKTYTLCIWTNSKVDIPLTQNGVLTTSPNTSISISGKNKITKGMNFFTFTIPSSIAEEAQNLIHMYPEFLESDFPIGYTFDASSSVIVGDLTDKLNSTVPFGLSSTGAIISNNGQQYPFCMPTIEGKTEVKEGKLVPLEPQGAQDVIKGLPVLGSVPFTKDIINMVNKTLKKTVDYYKITGEEIWRKTTAQVEGYFSAVMNLTDFASTSDSSQVCLLCNKLEYFYWSDNSLLQKEFIGHEVGTNGADMIIIRLKNSKATDVESLKNYLKQQLYAGTPYEMMYKKKTPTTIQLTEEQLKTYDAHRKIISLSKVGDMTDKFKTEEDGSATWIREVNSGKINSNSWLLHSEDETRTSFVMWNIHSLLKEFKPYSQLEVAGFVNKQELSPGKIYTSGDAVLVTTTPQTIDSFKNYWESLNVDVYYQLATPITTHIPKELMPTILTHETNILETGGAVKPSEFKVTVPVDLQAEIDQKLTQLEAAQTTLATLATEV